RYGYVYWIENERGDVFLEKRPEKGLLGGMVGFPTTEWIEKPELRHLSFVNNGEELSEKVKHVFTHFELTLRPFVIKNYSENNGNNYKKVPLREFDASSLPTVFKKAYRIFRSN
ncbi:MAG: A/G-specific adenine glycosylase, partial [Alphaproteobacteria bacterium]|nr:A/G-specific adenine glycosylase [Alphaproteobacteria bacterium]